MKIKVTMKDPDCLSDALADAVREYKTMLIEDKALPEDEAAAAAEAAKEKAYEIAGDFFEYGEYLTVIIDTDTKTATIQKPR